MSASFQPFSKGDFHKLPDFHVSVQLEEAEAVLLLRVLLWQLRVAAASFPFSSSCVVHKGADMTLFHRNSLGN